MKKSPWLDTVTGPISIFEAGVVDAHSHACIEPVDGVSAKAPVLDNKQAVISELKKFRKMGGKMVVDCQPPGCGRNAKSLKEISSASGVLIVASTGYHRRLYYPPDFWLFSLEEENAEALLRSFLQGG